MSPYAALYSHPVDQAIAWLLVLAWLTGGLFAMRSHVPFPEAGPERYCEAAASAFLVLSTLIAVNLGVGIVFLAWLKFFLLRGSVAGAAARVFGRPASIHSET